MAENSTILESIHPPMKNRHIKKNSYNCHAGEASLLKVGKCSSVSRPLFMCAWMEEPDGLPSVGSHRVGHD